MSLVLGRRRESRNARHAALGVAIVALATLWPLLPRMVIWAAPYPVADPGPVDGGEAVEIAISAAELVGPPIQALAVPNDDLSLAIPPVTSVLRREITLAWQLRLPPDVSPEELDWRYELIGINGQRHLLDHTGSLDSHIRVRVHPNPPTILRKEGDLVVVALSVVLELDVADVRNAGIHEGVLTVIVQ